MFSTGVAQFVLSFKKEAERGWKSWARSLSWKSGWKPSTRREFGAQRFRDMAIWSIFSCAIKFYIVIFRLCSSALYSAWYSRGLTAVVVHIESFAGEVLPRTTLCRTPTNACYAALSPLPLCICVPEKKIFVEWVLFVALLLKMSLDRIFPICLVAL